MKFSSFLLLLLGTTLFSCKLQDPEFKGIQNISISSVSDNEILLKGEGFFYNPNSIGLTLETVNVKLYLENEELGLCQQELNQKIDAKSDFTVPIEIKFPPDKLYKNLLQNFFGMLTKKEYEVRYVGEVKAQKFGFSFKIPVDEKKKIKI